MQCPSASVGCPITLATWGLHLPFLPNSGLSRKVSVVEQEEEVKAAGHRAEVGKEEWSQETYILEVPLIAFYDFFLKKSIYHNDDDVDKSCENEARKLVRLLF